MLRDAITNTVDVEAIVNSRNRITGKKDFLELPILGNITDKRNIDLLQSDLATEKRFNDPTIAYRTVAQTYKDSKEKYGIHLYRADRSIKFIDVDTFRQPSLYFKKYGRYCPFDPVYNKAAFNLYWDIFEYRRRNGMTAYAGIDINGEPTLVHIPGDMYGFLNMSVINKVMDDDDAISNDKDFEDIEPDNLAQFRIEDLIASLGVKTTKTAKKSVDFPDFFDGQYHLKIAKNFARLIGKNFFFGKARRKGCSYMNAFDQFNNIDLNPYISCILAAHDKKYLIHGKGLMKMVYTYSDFANKFTDFKKERLSNNQTHLKFGYIPEGQQEEHGYLSEVLAVSAMNNPDVTIGKDVYELSYEEMGKFPNWAESFEVSTSTAEAGDYKTGMICGWGTGGTEEANWKQFEAVVYNPDKADSLSCDNIWDEGKEGQACCYFYPHIESLEGHMDSNGNSNFDSAYEAYSTKKEDKRISTSDETEFEKWIGQRANSPAEAFSRSSTNVFPKIQILTQLEKVQHDPSIKYLHRAGVLVKQNDRIILRTNEEIAAKGLEIHPPVFDFPVTKNTDTHGCFVEWFPPYIDPRTGRVPDDMYISFQDPYAHSKEKGTINIKDSLGATYWFENVNHYTPYKGFVPVACLVGRPPSSDDYNEQVLYGNQRYRSKMMFENDRGDTARYFKLKRALEYLFEEPDLLSAKDLSSKTGRGFGMHMTEPRKARGAVYLRDLLTKPLGKTENGIDKTLIDYIFDPGFLNELLRWDMTGNFDRVSAWLIGAFIIKELEVLAVEPPRAYDDPYSLFNRDHY